MASGGGAVKRFEEWSGRWRAVALVITLFTIFHFTVVVVVNLSTDLPIGAAVIISLLAAIAVAVKYVVLGFASLPVYKNKRALALSFGVTMAVAVFSDLAVYIAEIFRLSDQLVVAYRAFLFQIAFLLALMMIALYLVFNQDNK